MDINDIRNYIKKYYIDQIDDIYDKVKIKDIDRTIDECDMDLRTITYTSDRKTETHQLIVLTHLLNVIIEYNVTHNTRAPYDLVYVSKHNFTTRGWVDLIGLKNMNIIKERVLLNNMCYQDTQVSAMHKDRPIYMGVYIKTFFDLLPPTHQTYEPQPQRKYEPSKYDQKIDRNSPPPPPQNQYNMYKNNTQYNGRARPPQPQNQYNIYKNKTQYNGRAKPPQPQNPSFILVGVNVLKIKCVYIIKKCIDTLIHEL